MHFTVRYSECSKGMTGAIEVNVLRTYTYMVNILSQVGDMYAFKCTIYTIIKDVLVATTITRHTQYSYRLNVPFNALHVQNTLGYTVC